MSGLRRAVLGCVATWLVAAAALGLAAASASAAPAGSFPLDLVNNTHGHWPDGKVYFTIFGQTASGDYAYVKSNGTTVPFSTSLASAPGHLEKNGTGYANMSFTLAQAKSVPMPPSLISTRIYVSLGAPMYIGIPAPNAYTGPSATNTTDPNYRTYYDWYEFNYTPGSASFFGNTTPVNMFGLPLLATVKQTATHFNQTRGIRLTRAQVYARYRATVKPPFKALANQYRILSPDGTPAFASGAGAGYLQSAIGAAWKQWQSGFSLSTAGTTFTGKVSGNTLSGTTNTGASFSITEPTTGNVFACDGTLAQPGASSASAELGADLCAAFNRGVVAEPTANWYTAAKYYKQAPYNQYAGFFHSISIGHAAYGFPYDDVNQQSSTSALPNSQAPTSLTLTVGW